MSRWLRASRSWKLPTPTRAAPGLPSSRLTPDLSIRPVCHQGFPKIVIVFLPRKKNREIESRYPTVSEYVYADPRPPVRHAILSMPGTESCYLKQAVPYEQRDWEAQDVATMRVMLQYLSDRMYDQIRGQGWTYGVSMSSSVTEGRIRVSFSRSSQLILAYNEFRQIIANYSSPDPQGKWVL